MQVNINTTAELLEFIKRDDVTADEAVEVVSKFLNVFTMFFVDDKNQINKDEVIKSTEYYITKWCQNNTGERPLFLDQKTDEFNIKDFY